MFGNLNPEEKAMLLQAPAYLTLSAIRRGGAFKSKVKRTALKLTHIKSYCERRELRTYYKEVEERLATQLDQLDKSLPVDPKEKELVVMTKLKEIGAVMKKMNLYHQILLRRSLRKFKNVVSRLDENLWEELLLPLIIDHINKGLHTEEDVFC